MCLEALLVPDVSALALDGLSRSGPTQVVYINRAYVRASIDLLMRIWCGWEIERTANPNEDESLYVQFESG